MKPNPNAAIFATLLTVCLAGCSGESRREASVPPVDSPVVEAAPAATLIPVVPPGPEMGPKSLARTMRPIEAVPGEAPMVLVANGEGLATVVLPDEAGPAVMVNFGVAAKDSVELAAKEFVDHVRRATGAELPVIRSKDFTGGPAVFLGESEASRKAGFRRDVTLPLEGFTVEVRGGSAAILGLDAMEYFAPGPNGARVREELYDSNGTLYGVYDVLERWVGVRWYWPDEELGTIIPQTKELSLPAVRYADWPLYTLRTLWPSSKNPNHWPDLGESGWLFHKRWRYGLGDGFMVNHSYNFWKDLYTETHPEFFLMRADGTREFVFYNGQLCFSEPGVLRQEIENLKNYYATGDRKPWGNWSVWPRASYIPVMPNDCNSRCFCGRCAVANAVRKDQDREGAESELVHGYFVKLAREIEKLWPEKWLHAGVYSNYLLPPETIEKYPPNVRVTLCMQVGMNLLKEKAKFDFWKKLVDRYVELCGGRPIYVWSYSNIPRFSTRAPILAPFNTVAWRQANRGTIAGEFIDHEAGNNRSYALDHLDLYFWIRTMWSPDVDVRAALDEYYTLVYGPSAAPMKAFYDLLIDRWENVPWGLPGPAGNGAAGALPMDKLYQDSYSPEVRAKLKDLLAEARRLAPAGSLYARRLDYVLPAYEPFFTEGEAMDRLNRGGAVAYAVAGTPKVDGRLDDTCWKHEGFRLGEAANGDPAPVDSRVWFASDDRGLYVAARLSEPEMDKIVMNAKKHDDAVFADDSFEIFICPSEDPETYLQVVINPEGTVFDGMKESVALYSGAKNFTLRKAVVRCADGWDVEIGIPFAEMGVPPFQPGILRRINVIQNRGKPDLAVRARGCYAFGPNFGQSFHNTRFFGSVIFPGPDRFREDFGPDAVTRWRPLVEHKKGFTNPEAYARAIPGDGFLTLEARMSKSLHIAKLVSDPSVEVPVRKGDQIEFVYRGPLHGPIRAELTYNLRTPDGKTHFGWAPDNNVVVGLPLRRLTADLFETASVKDGEAVLFNIHLTLSSEPDTGNALEAHMLRVSPWTSGNVK